VSHVKTAFTASSFEEIISEHIAIMAMASANARPRVLAPLLSTHYRPIPRHTKMSRQYRGRLTRLYYRARVRFAIKRASVVERVRIAHITRNYQPIIRPVFTNTGLVFTDSGPVTTEIGPVTTPTTHREGGLSLGDTVCVVTGTLLLFMLMATWELIEDLERLLHPRHSRKSYCYVRMARTKTTTPKSSTKWDRPITFDFADWESDEPTPSGNGASIPAAGYNSVMNNWYEVTTANLPPILHTYVDILLTI
jgi:hypothetical protein